MKPIFISLLLTFSLYGSLLEKKEINIKESTISNSTIVIFQGKEYNLEENEFFQDIKKFPQIEENLKEYFGKELTEVKEEFKTLAKSISNLTETTSKQFITIEDLNIRVIKLLKDKEELLKIIEKLKNEHSNTTYKALLEKAKDLLQTSQYNKYHQILSNYKKKKKHELTKLQKEMAEIAYLEAKVYETELNYIKAKELYKESINYDANNSIYLSYYSSFLNNFGKRSLSLIYAKRSLEIIKKTSKDNLNNPELAASYNNISLIYQDKGDLEQALIFSKKSLEILKNIYKNNPNHPILATCYNNIGSIYKTKGDLEQALIFTKKSLEIIKNVYKDNPNHAELASSYNTIGLVYLDKGDLEQAQIFSKKSLEILKNIYKDNPNHPTLATSYNNLSLIYKDKGNQKQALIYSKKSLKILEEIFKDNPRHPHLIVGYINIVDIYIAIKSEKNSALIYEDLKSEKNFIYYVKKYLEVVEK